MMTPWQSVLEGLVQKNHVTQLLRTPASVVQAVVRQGERLCAESDPRKGGYPAGYWAWPEVLLCCSQSGESSPRRGSDWTTTAQASQLKTRGDKPPLPPRFISFTQTWKMTPFHNLFFTQTRLLHIVLALFLSFEVKSEEVAPSLTPVSSLLDTDWDVLRKPKNNLLYLITLLTQYPT